MTAYPTRTKLTWSPRAACRGLTEKFYMRNMTQRTDEEEEDAKAICKACPVSQQCLDYAIANKETDGVWGGLTEKERRRLVRDARAINEKAS